MSEVEPGNTRSHELETPAEARLWDTIAMNLALRKENGWLRYLVAALVNEAECNGSVAWDDMCVDPIVKHAVEAGTDGKLRFYCAAHAPEGAAALPAPEAQTNG